MPSQAERTCRVERSVYHSLVWLTYCNGRTVPFHVSDATWDPAEWNRDTERAYNIDTGTPIKKEQLKFALLVIESRDCYIKKEPIISNHHRIYSSKNFEEAILTGYYCLELNKHPPSVPREHRGIP